MDRFKVRMWSEDEKKYFDGDIAYQCLMQQLAIGTESWYPIPYDHLEHGVVFEQCTGLKDKNGKLIFEGDIVDGGHHLFEVFYDKFHGFKKVPMGHDKETYGSWLHTHESLEITGNIHDNNTTKEN